MVERGSERGKTGTYQAVQIGTLYATLILTGLGGGWLAAHARYRTIFLLAAVVPLLAAASAVWIEEPAVGGKGGLLHQVAEQLGEPLDLPVLVAHAREGLARRAEDAERLEPRGRGVQRAVLGAVVGGHDRARLGEGGWTGCR